MRASQLISAGFIKMQQFRPIASSSVPALIILAGYPDGGKKTPGR